jgi:predicted DNA-binding transcriptional regulator AlpA
MNETYLTIKDLCRLFAVTRSTLYAMRQQRDFPAAFLFAGRPRWRQSEVLAWIDRQRAEANDSGITKKLIVRNCSDSF